MPNIEELERLRRTELSKSQLDWERINLFADLIRIKKSSDTENRISVLIRSPGWKDYDGDRFPNNGDPVFEYLTDVYDSDNDTRRRLVNKLYTRKMRRKTYEALLCMSFKRFTEISPCDKTWFKNAFDYQQGNLYSHPNHFGSLL